MEANANVANNPHTKEGEKGSGVPTCRPSTVKSQEAGIPNTQENIFPEPTDEY